MNINKGSICNECEFLHIIESNFNVPMCMGGSVRRVVSISDSRVTGCTQYMKKFESHNRKAGSSSGLRKDNPRRK